MKATEPIAADLGDIAPDALGLAGGKAVNLGILIRAGLPVPPGYCLTTAAYRRAVGSALDGVIAELAAVAPADTAALAEAARRARELVLAAPVPEEAARAVREREGEDGGPVAVRSSATAEDLPQASFAGQQDTFLGVAGAPEVLEAVRRCWASLWTDRAVAYRAANGIDHASVLLAVVVQRMVPAEAAGVMFTADPVAGTRNRAVIEAAPGLGEAVVSGAVDPDRFTVDLSTGRILQRRPGARPAPEGPGQTGAGAGGGSGRGPALCLADGQVRALARLGERVERLYGAPQDIEWAIGPDGAPQLVQARPITTLFPVPVRRAPGGDLRVYFNFSLAQGVQRPFTPMGIEAFRLMSAGVARRLGFRVDDPRDGAPAVTEGGGRLFLDATNAVSSSLGRTVLPRLMGIMEARSAQVFRTLTGDPRFPLRYRSPWPVLRRVVPAAVRGGVPAAFVRALADPAGTRARALRLTEEVRRRSAVPPTADPVRLLDDAECLLMSVLPVVMVRSGPVLMAAGAALLAAIRLLGPRLRPGEVAEVLQGVPHNVTTEMDLALWRLAEQVRAVPAAARPLLDASPEESAARYAEGTLPEPLASGLDGFLAVYGHRAVAEIDLGAPRWSEDPRHVLGVLGNYLRLEDPAAAPGTRFAAGAAAAEARLGRLAGRAGPVRGPLVRFALGRVRALVGLRELPKFTIVLALAGARRRLREVGAALAAEGALDRAEDVFFVTLAEARAGLAGADLREAADRRRRAYDRESARRRLPRVILSDGTEPEAVAAPAPASGAALTGVPASPGTASGPARVVLDPAGARIEPGEILVCPSTDPGWTPLFLTAGGLVMEMGGANSHGAVVAREYGIPAVVGVARATELIPDGAGVTVDGTSGTAAVEAGA
ncbi:PEP/pyruvate-binding domain-containing protein [Nocardiopsis potens]|uniref:PEP/pyruvate-binding domain-containing protein n=1 Tax=Nocardiopsis potens TaxID=1246458 RepID=UPI00034739EE|nr:PEP/pyruvate-binding domain-containing protein [Nocardiopsis potens]